MKKSRIVLCYTLLYSIFIVLSLVLSSCSFPGFVTTTGQLPVVHSSSKTQPLSPIRFPQDEAAHRYLTEWWYYTGHINATLPDGKSHHYGFELVVFQALRSDLPPVYAAHFAISDVTRGEFHYDQRRQTEPNAIIPNGTSTSGINVSVGNWTIRGVNGLDHLAAEMANYAMQVNLQATKPPTLHNGNGLITYGLGGFSYYYSRTRMALSGTLIDHNQTVQVTGEAWMDHQWGNFLALGGGGWDWFSIQLNNNTEMMIYLIRDASGKILTTYIGYISPHAEDILLPEKSLQVKVLDHWRSPVTGANYPSSWQLNINTPAQLQGAPQHISLMLIPELKDQELVAYQSTGNSYWEGAVHINGQIEGTNLQGEGYVELTGYQK